MSASLEKKVELRLNKVAESQTSYAMKFYLHYTDANQNSKKVYAGYLSIFGHGYCIGGPGHCDPPPAEIRHGDLRPRSHATPTNLRLDITEAVKTAFLDQAETFEIEMEMVGDENSYLRMGDMSVHFY